jgi:hypothetical protein
MSPRTHKIRVMIVDDHAILRAGLKMLVNVQADMEVVSSQHTFRAGMKCRFPLNADHNPVNRDRRNSFEHDIRYLLRLAELGFKW